jgi:hypothetical protein
MPGREIVLDENESRHESAQPMSSHVGIADPCLERYRMNPFSFGLPAWLFCAAIAYFLHKKAIGQLSAEQIGQLTLVHRSGRTNALISCIGILVVFLALRFGFPSLMNIWFPATLFLVAAASVFFEVKGMRLMRAIAPTNPARMLVSASVVGLAGLASLLGAMAITVFLH